MATELLAREGWQSPSSTPQDISWISVNEQKPPVDRYILLCTSGGSMAMGWLRADGTWEIDLPRGIDFTPFYWQFPPDAPTAAAADNLGDVALGA